MRILVGIDDTDNLESRGTGFRARELGRELVERGLADMRGISRHQLYVHPDIPYTSHNSALCLDIVWRGGSLTALGDYTRDYLARTSAPGSDAGLCIAPYDDVPDTVVAFGQSAKSVVLNKTAAASLASNVGFRLEGVTGDHGGIIGSLACVGLRKSGNDGRFVWVEGVRDLDDRATARHLLEHTGIDRLHDPKSGGVPKPDDLISVAPWPRPVLLNHEAVLLIEKAEETHGGVEWRIVPREETKRY
ncbi:MAG: hypothetical protein K2Y05_04655 [Hyphomicrobiaceae bacterium]|nr:hypothetical protein [Hyphomicrobiaceae bacterium]